MKMKSWLLSLVMGLNIGLMAQTDTGTATPPAPTAPPPTAPPSTAAPADASAPATAPKPKAKKKKKKATTTTPEAAKPKPADHAVLSAPTPATVKEDNLNVRAQSSFVGEVVTHLKKGDSVTVLEEITPSAPKKGEPKQWSKILLPSSTPVWVSAEYLDADGKTAAKRLNVRGGPGENFSVVARLDKGATIKEIKKDKGWVCIEPPADAVGYVASDFIDKQATPPAPVPAPEPTPVAVPAPEVVKVQPEATAAPAPTPAPEPAPAPAPAPPPVVETKPVPAPEPPPAEVKMIPTKRVITRDGFLRKARNIQAPADFELRDIQTGEITEYIQPTTGEPTDNLKHFIKVRVKVTGEEYVDKRWPATPIMRVESVSLLP